MTHQTTKETHETKESARDRSQFPTLSIDWELYFGYLEDSDLSYDQKVEFIKTLWNIQLTWVDLGLGIHPVQQACEQNQQMKALQSQEFDSVINSSNSNSEFNRAADGLSGQEDTRSQ